jgi:CheY-like chemotaxis protein
LLEDPEAGSNGINQRLLRELDSLREQKQQVMRENEMRPQQDLANSRLLHDISNELIGEQNIAALYGKIAAAGARLMRAPCASIQILLAEQGSVVELQLLGHRGLIPEAAKFGERVRIGADSAPRPAPRRAGRWPVPPSVLLLDLGMPDMDGYEVARPIVAAGFDHHLIKPVDFAGLAALLTRHLERKSKHI